MRAVWLFWNDLCTNTYNRINIVRYHRFEEERHSFQSRPLSDVSLGWPAANIERIPTYSWTALDVAVSSHIAPLRPQIRQRRVDTYQRWRLDMLRNSGSSALHGADRIQAHASGCCHRGTLACCGCVAPCALGPPQGGRAGAAVRLNVLLPMNQLSQNRMKHL